MSMAFILSTTKLLEWKMLENRTYAVMTSNLKISVTHNELIFFSHMTELSWFQRENCNCSYTFPLCQGFLCLLVLFVSTLEKTEYSISSYAFILMIPKDTTYLLCSYKA